MQEDSPLVDFLEHFPIAITCPICEEQYNEQDHLPLLLCDGQHYICEICLNKSLDYVEEDEEILCPFCKEPLFEDRVKNFRLMLQVLRAVQGLRGYNNEVRALIDDLLRGNRKIQKELEEERKINENKTNLVRNLYIEIEKREQEIMEMKSKELQKEEKKKNKESLNSHRLPGKSKSVKDCLKNNVTISKKHSKSKTSAFQKGSAVESKKKLVTMIEIPMREQNEEQIQEKLSEYQICLSQEDEIPLEPIVIGNNSSKNKNKHPLPYLTPNSTCINPEELKRLSKNELRKEKQEKDQRKLYISLLVKYDFSRIKQLNLAKMNFIESHLDPLLKIDSFSFLNLSKLNLSHNRFTLIPAFVYQLKTLTYLNLSNNHLSRVSDQLSELTNLQVLDLWKNKLNVVPFILYKLKKLRKVDLSNNQIHSVQPWMLQGTIKIDLFGNPLILNSIRDEKKQTKSEVFLNSFINKLNKSMI